MSKPQRDRPERRPLISTAIILLFSLLLVGTSKRKSPPLPLPAPGAAGGAPVGSTSASTAAASSAVRKLAVPSTKGWTKTRLPVAKVSLALPPGAGVKPPEGGHDPEFAGHYFYVPMAGGYEVYFAEKHGVEPTTIAAKKRFYAERAGNFAGYIFEGEDAVVARRNEAPPLGAYCETTVCATVGERRLCAASAGALMKAGRVTKLTDEQCLQVVAIARSLEALP